MNSKFLSFLGLTRKSGNLIVGGNLTESEIKRGRVKLLIIASDASINTKKRFEDFGKKMNIDILVPALKSELGRALGKDEVSVLGVRDENMSRKLKELSGMR